MDKKELMQYLKDHLEVVLDTERVDVDFACEPDRLKLIVTLRLEGEEVSSDEICIS